MRTITRFILVISVFAVSVNAQIVPKVSVGFFGGLAFPTGDFGSTSSVGAGGASTGFAFGGEVGIPLPGGLSVLGSTTLAFNSLSEKYFQDASGSSSSVSGDLGSWTTIWPMAGIRYSGSFTPAAGYYLQGQVGLLFGSTPEVNASQGGYRYTAKSASSSALAYGFGVGVVFARVVNVSLRYSGGQPTYEYTVTETISQPGFTSTTTYNTKNDHPATMFQLLVGVTF
ncbi:MAG TPA: hypothetical protein VNL36_03215 [Bacteroidota bacterium]|nr:hypothetical protein [Bacteroidota bacterium]